MSDELPKRLQAAMLRIRADHPFFGTLALFVEMRVTEDVATAATDGEVIWFNPGFVEQQDQASLCGLVTHELLHAALQHGIRRSVRDPLQWNIAADIVVNGMIRQDTQYTLPAGVIEEPKLAHLSVEEVYEQLASGRHRTPVLAIVDLMPGGLGSGAPSRAPSLQGADGNDLDGAIMADRAARLQRHWRAALQQAGAVARRISKGFGRVGLEASREYRCATESSLSWRELLWQHLVSTPHDFAGFDRRFVHRKLYLEDMVGETVEVAICIDTSGSIGDKALASFIAEIQGILDAYPKIRGSLFFADADLYGPFEFSIDAPRPEAKGGGGTDFCPFFRWIGAQHPDSSKPLCIYLTDGYGLFPEAAPSQTTLWVVAQGGEDSSGFPFGEVVRMANQ